MVGSQIRINIHVQPSSDLQSAVLCLYKFDLVLQKVVEKLERAQSETRQIEESKRKLELNLLNTRKQFEAQELVRVILSYPNTACTLNKCILFLKKAAMLKRSAELLEEELNEAKASAEEAKAKEAKWKAAK